MNQKRLKTKIKKLEAKKNLQKSVFKSEVVKKSEEDKINEKIVLIEKREEISNFFNNKNFTIKI